MSDFVEQLQEFETIQSIYDNDKLSFDQTYISKLVKLVYLYTLIKYPQFCNALAINLRIKRYKEQTQRFEILFVDH